MQTVNPNGRVAGRHWSESRSSVGTPVRNSTVVAGAAVEAAATEAIARAAKRLADRGRR